MLKLLHLTMQETEQVRLPQKLERVTLQFTQLLLLYPLRLMPTHPVAVQLHNGMMVTQFTFKTQQQTQVVLQYNIPGNGVMVHPMMLLVLTQMQVA